MLLRCSTTRATQEGNWEASKSVCSDDWRSHCARTTTGRNMEHQLITALLPAHRHAGGTTNLKCSNSLWGSCGSYRFPPSNTLTHSVAEDCITIPSCTENSSTINESCSNQMVEILASRFEVSFSPQKNARKPPGAGNRQPLLRRAAWPGAT